MSEQNEAFRPISPSELMMYSTVRLFDNKSSGTAFFFHFTIDSITIPVLVTNKHVVSNKTDTKMKFVVHLGRNGIDSGKNYEAETVLSWIFHPTHDICITPILPILEKIKAQTSNEVFYNPLTEELIYDSEELKQLSALEAVTMVGYPKALFDGLHNFPIFRRGYTAAHPGFDFDKKGEGLVDMACFPGSSGSPIFILDETEHYDKLRNAVSVGGRLIFLGILHSGPVMSAKGRIIVPEMQVPTATDIMINLGYYVKADLLMDFLPILKETIK